MSDVAIISCTSYEEAEVLAAVERGVSLLGGAEKFVQPEEKFLLKLNWLSADPPEKCVTTHPAVFRAVATVFQRAGARLSYGDSPGFQPPETAAKKSGAALVAEQLSIPLGDFRTGKEIHFPEGRQNKRFTIANAVLESDGVISLPKMKTHAFQRVTGAVKNQFGCIPGALKGEFHVKIPSANDFAKMLIDLNSFVHPRLYIMDGIMAMEGNGPRGGDPRKMNVLLFSTDPVALDATMCRLMSLDPALVLTNIAGAEQGLGTYLAQEIHLLGDPIEGLIATDFVVNREPESATAKRAQPGFVKAALTPRPYIVAEKCVRCGICVQMCPVTPKVVNWHDGNKQNPPSYQYDRCIRCYCCQEVCPESAIFVKVPFLRRVLDRK
ncbi:MAG: DUF362 domain-containing protein [Eubacteriales bacterium]|nr:DUF362 domain-containing protein [Eubacteriales bacterium]